MSYDLLFVLELCQFDKTILLLKDDGINEALVLWILFGLEYVQNIVL